MIATVVHVESDHAVSPDLAFTLASEQQQPAEQAIKCILAGRLPENADFVLGQKAVTLHCGVYYQTTGDTAIRSRLLTAHTNSGLIALNSPLAA